MSAETSRESGQMQDAYPENRGDMFEASSWFLSDEAETVQLIPDTEGLGRSKLDLEVVD